MRTDLQSGNVVLRAKGSATVLKKGVEAALATVVAHDPFAGRATDRSRYLVVFLEKAPPPAWRRRVDDSDHDPDEVAVQGKEIYLWLPKGVRDSKLAREATGKGVGVGTARNWNVVTKLAELAAG